MFIPSVSLRFTHQVKFNINLWKMRTRKARSPRPRCFLSILYTRQAAQACTGGFTSPSDHSYAGNCPLGCMYHSRVSSTSCSLANSASTSANEIEECQVPGGEPGILPLVGHGNDLGVVDVRPFAIAAETAHCRWSRLRRIAL